MSDARTPRAAGRWLTVAAFALFVVVLAAVGLVVGGGGEWFPAATATGDGAVRQAASGTGGTNQPSDLGNAIAGSCTTRFEYHVIRLRIEVTSDSQRGVAVELPNTGVAGEPVEVGQGRTFTLDKGAGHCKFAGPSGTIDLAPGTIAVSTKEGYTGIFGDTSLDGSVSGNSFSLDEGGSMAFAFGELVRPRDPSSKTAELVLRVRNVRLPSGFTDNIRGR